MNLNAITIAPSPPQSTERAVATFAPAKVETVPWSEFSKADWDAWEAVRAESPQYRSPFYSPRFSQAVAEAKGSVEVLTISRSGVPTAFLPYERTPQGMAPVGGAFNDAHGVICSPLHPLDYRDLVEQGDLHSYFFHALDGVARGYEPYAFGSVKSFMADLTRHPKGYVAYLEETRGTIFKQRRKTKKMVKDLGPLRLDFDCRDRAVFETMIALKRAQYQRTYIFDILSVDWARQMMRDLWEDRTSACRGLLSCLYAGDTLVAVHYGMIEGDWLHYWFPTYEPCYHQYSPGTALFLEIARRSEQLGVSKIDMGYGEQGYKIKLTDTITEMPYGYFHRSRLRRGLKKSKLLACAALKQIPFKETAKKIVRSVWPGFGQAKYQ